MLKFIIAFLILPTAGIVFAEAVQSFFSVLVNIRVTLALVSGITAYSLFHYFCARMVPVYVFAHELTHAFAGLLCGFRIKEFSVGKTGGYVVLSGSNSFVSLAPYFVPLYSFFVAAAYFASGLWGNMTPYRDWFVGALGFFLAFHVIHTYETLTEQKQSDIKQAGGAFFSYSAILLANSLVLLLSFKMLYPGIIDARKIAGRTASRTVAFWRGAAGFTAKSSMYVYDYFAGRGSAAK